MQQYKLKIDARKFFSDDYAKTIESSDYWKKKLIPIELLDEVPRVYIDYGHESTLSSGNKATHSCGWRAAGKKAEFHFTVKVSDMEYVDYDNINIGELMDKIQETMNEFIDLK